MDFNIQIQGIDEGYELSCVHLGLRISKVYYGYTLADSLEAFQYYLTDGFSS